MNRVSWKNAVINKWPQGNQMAVYSPSHAWKVMTERWPVVGGKAFWPAQELCLFAMERKTNPEEARSAFVEAAKEAGLLQPYDSH